MTPYAPPPVAGSDGRAEGQRGGGPSAHGTTVKAPLTGLEPLTDDELSLYDELTATIERGLSSFVEVGDALLTIRDSRLYRQGYATFEHYCSERWGLSRTRSYELMAAAGVVESLSAIADTPSLPANEGQARALTPLKAEPEKMAEAMERATDRAESEGRTPTARDITDAVAAVKDGTGKPRRGPLPEQFRKASWELVKAVERLQRLAADDRFAGHRETIEKNVGSTVRHATSELLDLAVELGAWG